MDVSIAMGLNNNAVNQAEPVPRTEIDFYNELRVTGTLDLGEPVRYGLRHAPVQAKDEVLLSASLLL